MVSPESSCYDAAIMGEPRTEKQIRSAIVAENAVATSQRRPFQSRLAGVRGPAVRRRRHGAGRRSFLSLQRPLSVFQSRAAPCGLRDEGIVYVFLGDLLGGRPSRPSLYDDDGRVDYERVRRTEAFQRGLEQLTHGLSGNTVAFLCSEEDPLDCHRGLMIAPALCECGHPPSHLRKDGSVETNERMERRLLEKTGVGAGILDGLFAVTLSHEECHSLLAEAYRRLALRKAYRLQGDPDRE